MAIISLVYILFETRKYIRKKKNIEDLYTYASSYLQKKIMNK